MRATRTAPLPQRRGALGPRAARGRGRLRLSVHASSGGYGFQPVGVRAQPAVHDPHGQPAAARAVAAHAPRGGAWQLARGGVGARVACAERADERSLPRVASEFGVGELARGAKAVAGRHRWAAACGNAAGGVTWRARRSSGPLPCGRGVGGAEAQDPSGLRGHGEGAGFRLRGALSGARKRGSEQHRHAGRGRNGGGRPAAADVDGKKGCRRRQPSRAGRRRRGWRHRGRRRRRRRRHRRRRRSGTRSGTRIRRFRRRRRRPGSRRRKRARRRAWWSCRGRASCRRG